MFVSYLRLGYVVALLLAIAAVPLISTWLRKSKYKYPPGPKGIPVFGNLFQLPPKYPSAQLMEWGKQFGDLYAYRHIAVICFLTLLQIHNPAWCEKMGLSQLHGSNSRTPRPPWSIVHRPTRIPCHPRYHVRGEQDRHDDPHREMAKPSQNHALASDGEQCESTVQESLLQTNNHASRKHTSHSRMLSREHFCGSTSRTRTGTTSMEVVLQTRVGPTISACGIR